MVVGARRWRTAASQQALRRVKLQKLGRADVVVCVFDRASSVLLCRPAEAGRFRFIAIESTDNRAMCSGRYGGTGSSMELVRVVVAVQFQVTIVVAQVISN